MRPSWSGQGHRSGAIHQLAAKPDETIHLLAPEITVGEILDALGYACSLNMEKVDGRQLAMTMLVVFAFFGSADSTGAGESIGRRTVSTAAQTPSSGIAG